MKFKSKQYMITPHGTFHKHGVYDSNSYKNLTKGTLESWIKSGAIVSLDKKEEKKEEPKTENKSVQPKTQNKRGRPRSK